MTDPSRPSRGGWAYLSLVSAVPGVDLTPRAAIALQFVLFEAATVGLAAAYGRWDTLPLATAAVVVATAGSAVMSTLAARIRALEPPPGYRWTLFDSSADVFMGLVAYTLLVTYLLLGARTPDGGLLVRLLGEPLPPAAVAFGLLLAWDVCYRIGTAWWVSLTGLWRTLQFGGRLEPSAVEAYRRIDRLTVGFAALQLVLVPWLLEEPVLAALVAGHVAAVIAVSGGSSWLLARRCRRNPESMPSNAAASHSRE